MERLTHERANGIRIGYWSPNKKQELVDRLAEYENTMLDSEEILRLKKLDTPKEPEWEYDDECICPNCGKTIEAYDVTRMCRCPECGQRWKFGGRGER